MIAHSGRQQMSGVIGQCRQSRRLGQQLPAQISPFNIVLLESLGKAGQDNLFPGAAYGQSADVGHDAVAPYQFAIEIKAGDQTVIGSAHEKWSGWYERQVVQRPLALSSNQ